ncbi:MAG: hypothetical protein LBN35_03475 [Clostridiales Family XIII bacterium]|jgi:hypothetical protein|nr:hypothetical protein [Clostridiales Family XIII bacterium]
MKQFIVLLAVLPLMLGMLMQIGLAQTNFTKIMRIEQIIEDYRYEASEAGGFTPEMKQEMAAKLARASGTGAGEIYLNLDPPRPADMEGEINYSIVLPAGKLVAANRLFGIKDKDNDGYYKIEGSVPNRNTPEIPEPEPESED